MLLKIICNGFKKKQHKEMIEVEHQRTILQAKIFHYLLYLRSLMGRYQTFIMIITTLNLTHIRHRSLPKPNIHSNTSKDVWRNWQILTSQICFNLAESKKDNFLINQELVLKIHLSLVSTLLQATMEILHTKLFLRPLEMRTDHSSSLQEMRIMILIQKKQNS